MSTGNCKNYNNIRSTFILLLSLWIISCVQRWLMLEHRSQQTNVDKIGLIKWLTDWLIDSIEFTPNRQWQLHSNVCSDFAFRDGCCTRSSFHCHKCREYVNISSPPIAMLTTTYQKSILMNRKTSDYKKN